MSSSLAWGAAARLPAESEAKRGDDDGISSGVSRAAEAKSGHDDGTSGVSRAAAHWFRPSLERRSAAQLEAERWVLFFRSSGAYRRWMAVAPCVAVQACCGSIYSWSIFNAKMDTTVWHSPGTNAIGFLLSVAAYGSATFLLGAHIGRLGPFAGCARAAVLLPAAWALAAAASAGGSLLGLCIGYGVLLGVGIAHGYLSTTSVMQKWFPEYKGLAAGVAVAGFGLGAFGWTLLGKALLQGGASVPTVQLVFAGIIAVAMLAALPFMRLPPPGWQPAAEAAAAAAAPPAAPPGVAAAATEAAVAAASLPAALPPPPPLTAASRQPDRDYTLAEAACTLEFWLVALLVFGSSMPGVVFLSSAADMAHYAFALNSADAFSITAAQNGINCLGRLGWGLASDRLGRKTFYLLAALGQALAVALMPAAVRGGQLALWLAAFLSIGSLYGGTFGVLPALTAELWGPGISSATHGAMLSFWALSAVVGVPIFTRVTATHAVIVVDPTTGAASAQPTPDAYAVNAEWLLALPLAAAAAAAALNTRTRDRVLRRAAHQALRLRLPAGRVLVVGGGGGGGGACCGCARPRCRVLNAEQQADEWAAHLAAAAGEQPAQPALQRAPPPP